jgi:hypothetical protein
VRKGSKTVFTQRKDKAHCKGQDLVGLAQGTATEKKKRRQRARQKFDVFEARELGFFFFI